MKDRIDFAVGVIKEFSLEELRAKGFSTIILNDYSVDILVELENKRIRIQFSLHHLDLPWELNVSHQKILSINQNEGETQWNKVSGVYYVTPKILNDDEALSNLIRSALSEANLGD
jgi:hypothetical protein